MFAGSGEIYNSHDLSANDWEPTWDGPQIPHTQACFLDRPYPQIGTTELSVSTPEIQIVTAL
jgi:hypothetical protein